MATGQKGRKLGRWKKSPSNQRYKAEMRWISNKKRKLATYCKHYPNDLQAKRALEKVR